MGTKELKVFFLLLFLIIHSLLYSQSFKPCDYIYEINLSFNKNKYKQFGFRIYGKPGIYTALHGLFKCGIKSTFDINKVDIKVIGLNENAKYKSDCEIIGYDFNKDILVIKPKIDILTKGGFYIADMNYFNKLKKNKITHFVIHGVPNIKCKSYEINTTENIFDKLKSSITIEELKKLNHYFDINTNVLNLVGELDEGQSGAPICHNDSMLVGIVSGGKSTGFHYAPVPLYLNIFYLPTNKKGIPSNFDDNFKLKNDLTKLHIFYSKKSLEELTFCDKIKNILFYSEIRKSLIAIKRGDTIEINKFHSKLWRIGPKEDGQKIVSLRKKAPVAYRFLNLYYNYKVDKDSKGKINIKTQEYTKELYDLIMHSELERRDRRYDKYLNLIANANDLINEIYKDTLYNHYINEGHVHNANSNFISAIENYTKALNYKENDYIHKLINNASLNKDSLDKQLTNSFKEAILKKDYVSAIEVNKKSITNNPEDSTLIYRKNILLKRANVDTSKLEIETINNFISGIVKSQKALFNVDYGDSPNINVGIDLLHPSKKVEKFPILSKQQIDYKISFEFGMTTSNKYYFNSLVSNYNLGAYKNIGTDLASKIINKAIINFYKNYNLNVDSVEILGTADDYPYYGKVFYDKLDFCDTVEKIQFLYEYNQKWQQTNIKRINLKNKSDENNIKLAALRAFYILNKTINNYSQTKTQIILAKKYSSKGGDFRKVKISFYVSKKY